MTFSDGVVDGACMHEAAVVIEQMDAQDAISWLRQTEDTLGVHIQRAAQNVIGRLKEQHGLLLNDVQQGVLMRMVITTAVAAVTALKSGHYEMWRDLMTGTPLADVDPLLSIRRRIRIEKPKSLPSSKTLTKKHRRVEASAGTEVSATKFAFISCACATDAVDSKTKFLLLTAAKADGTSRHEVIYLRDGDVLLRHLIDGLARLGSASAKATWNLVCRSDANFSSVPDGVPPLDDRGGKDDKGDVTA